MERAERDKFYLIDNLVYGTKYSEDLEKDKIEADWCNDFTYIPRLECQQSKSLREKFVPNIIGPGEGVEEKKAKVKPNNRAFFDEAQKQAIVDAKLREGLGILRKAMPVGLDANIEQAPNQGINDRIKKHMEFVLQADIDKPMAPEDAFEAKPKKHVNWWDDPF